MSLRTRPHSCTASLSTLQPIHGSTKRSGELIREFISLCIRCLIRTTPPDLSFARLVLQLDAAFYAEIRAATPGSDGPLFRASMDSIEPACGRHVAICLRVWAHGWLRRAGGQLRRYRAGSLQNYVLGHACTHACASQEHAAVVSRQLSVSSLRRSAGACVGRRTCVVLLACAFRCPH